MRGLDGKRVLVTGAAQGIGLAVARRFLADGCRVVLTDVAPTLEDSVAELAAAGSPAFAVRMDVADESDVVRGFAEADGLLGGLDVLINNAGIQRGAPSHELTVEDLDRVLGVNLRGAVLCAREALARFVAQPDVPGAGQSGGPSGGQGCIVNTSSVHEVIPKPGYLPYSLAKGAVGNLTRTLALEYADRGIRVNAVAPGVTHTPLNAWLDDPVQAAAGNSHIPVGRPAAVDEVTGAYAFLASDDASYITGQTLYVDGGLVLNNDFRTGWAS